MKYFLDTEFHEYKKHGINTIELISIGIVREDDENGDKSLYMISNQFNIDAAYQNFWLKNNVLKPIFKENVDDRVFSYYNLDEKIMEFGKTDFVIKETILEFIGDDEKPEFYGYYCDYDWVVFCWLFGRMIDLPKHFPMYCRDLKQMLDEAVAKKRLKELHSRGHSRFDLEKAKLLPEYPKQENEHNALADALWNKKLYEFIQGL